MAIFIHSSKLLVMTSVGTLITGVSRSATALDLRPPVVVLEVFAAPATPSASPAPAAPDGPASALSMAVIFVLFLLRLFSAASSLMLTVFGAGRGPSS